MVDGPGGRKPKRSWILIVLAIALAVTIWAAGRLVRNDETAVSPDPDESGVASTTGATSSAVSDYVRFAASDAGPGPEYVAEGLRKLAGATGSMGVGNPELAVNLRVTAEHVLLNPDAVETSSSVRTALTQVTAAIAEENRAAGDALREPVDALDARAPLANQHATLQQFFRRSGVAIEQLAGTLAR